jgi:circadian clock protein KaiC
MGSTLEVASMAMRLVDFLKMNDINLVMTALTDASERVETTQVNISSLVDTWLLLSNLGNGGVRRRRLSVVKARGMGNSNQTHELLITKKGVSIKPAARSGKYS